MTGGSEISSEVSVPRPASTTGVAYDAFISYSHAADGQDGDKALWPGRAVQRGLQRLTLPWYRRRSDTRVFYDEASLPASEDLWRNIERALARSRYFVLMASPQAAASEYVRREIAFWR